MILYLETTAIFDWLSESPRTVAIRKLIRSEEGVVVANHTDLEFAYGLRRLQDLGVPLGELTRLGVEYERVSKDFVRVMTDALMGKASLLSVKHSLKPGDALHLAAALHMLDQIMRQAPRLPMNPIIFATARPKLFVAAIAEGFRVWP